MASTDETSLIALPLEDTVENYLTGFWRWVGLLASGDFQGAVDALYWPSQPRWNPTDLETEITNFFGGAQQWSVVIPNRRLIDEINAAADWAPPNEKGWGWMLAMVPVTTAPDDPKDDLIPLMGIGTSFYLRQIGDTYAMEFEIFHA